MVNLNRKLSSLKKNSFFKVGIPVIGFSVLGALFLSEAMQFKYLSTQRNQYVGKDEIKDNFSLEEELKVCLCICEN